MEYHLRTEVLQGTEVVFDGCQEQPVDLTLSLPDYCPDIQRILKCQIYPCITSKSIVGDSLEVNGNTMLRILYVDSVGLPIRCCEKISTFTTNIPMKKTLDNPIAFVKAKVEYVNCRATSPRKLDIHGAFSVCAKVLEHVPQDILCDIEGDDIQQMKSEIEASNIAGMTQEAFSVSEVLEISSGKQAAETIIRSDCSITMDDMKVLDNKLILQGEVIVKILYSSGMGETLPEHMEYTIPYSQMIDCAGVTEQCMCDVRVEAMGADVQIKTDSAGETMLFEAEVRAMAHVTAYMNERFTVVTDAYSTEHNLNLEYKQHTLHKLVEIIKDSDVQKNNFEVDDIGISQVIDVWNEMKSVTASIDEGNIVYSGKYNVCILAMGSEGKPFYFERMVDFKCSHDWSNTSDSMKCDAMVHIKSMNYRITGNSGIEVKVELSLTAAILQEFSYKAIIAASTDEEHPVLKDSKAALIIYYAETGESLWNIARQYYTSVNAIKEENDLSDDNVVSKGMLFIPV